MKNKRKFDGWNDIDWGIELETIQFDLNAIKSHNKNNPDIGEKWNVWTQEMEGIMLLPLKMKQYASFEPRSEVKGKFIPQ